MENLNEKDLREINGGSVLSQKSTSFPNNIGCGGGDGIIFNSNNHGPLIGKLRKFNL